jgi:hypothetical protein
MATGRRGFLRGLLGGTAGAAATGVVAARAPQLEVNVTEPVVRYDQVVFAQDAKEGELVMRCADNSVIPWEHPGKVYGMAIKAHRAGSTGMIRVHDLSVPRPVLTKEAQSPMFKARK